MALQTNNAGAALVAGARVPDEGTMTVRVLRGFLIAGVRQHEGQVVTLPRLTAIDMIYARKAERYTEPPVSVPAPIVSVLEQPKTEPVPLQGSAKPLRQGRPSRGDREHV